MNLKDILKISKHPLTFNGLTRQEIQSHPVYQSYGEAFLACAGPRIPTKEMLKREIPNSVLESITDEKLLCIFCNHLMLVPIIIKSCGHKFCEQCIQKYRLSYNSKNCPQCRARIASKREFQVDKNLQKLIEKTVKKPAQFEDKLSKVYGENYAKAMEDVKKHPSNELRVKHIKNRGTLRGRKKFSTKSQREQQEESQSSQYEADEEEEKSEQEFEESEKQNKRSSRLRQRKATNHEKEEPKSRKKKKYFDKSEIKADLEITLEQVSNKKSKCKLQRAKLTIDRRMSILQFKKYLALKNHIQGDKASQFVVLLECPNSEERFTFVDDSFRFVDFLEMKSKRKELPSCLSVFYDATKLQK